MQRGGNTKKGDWIPFRFVFTEKVSLTDKLLLAFDAFVFSQITGSTRGFGEIIHGRQYRTKKIALTALYAKVRSLLTRIAAQQADTSPPPLVLNKHCAKCQYASRCGPIAKNVDDLSLLSKIGPDERQRYRQKSIFTVTQLSYTFRHRRNNRLRHDHALKALAIRKNQIHVVGKVAWSGSGTQVYIDVEGDPDCDFYYCIGLRLEAASLVVQRSYWLQEQAEPLS